MSWPASPSYATNILSPAEGLESELFSPVSPFISLYMVLELNQVQPDGLM